MTRVCVLLLGFLSASCDASTIELLADLPDEGSLSDASGGLLPSGDGSSGVVTPECTDSAQCGGSLRHCDIAKQYCVQCLNDDHCAEGQMCKAGQCLAVCAEDADCGGEAASLCDTGGGFCVECHDDSQCTSTTLPLCFGDTGQCVQCLTDAHCTDPEVYCNVRFHSCDACLRNDHCALNEFCDVNTGNCMAIEPL